MNDYAKALAVGSILGTTFTIAAAVADILSRRNLPRVEVFLDPSHFLASLHKST